MQPVCTNPVEPRQAHPRRSTPKPLGATDGSKHIQHAGSFDPVTSSVPNVSDASDDADECCRIDDIRTSHFIELEYLKKSAAAMNQF